MIGIFDSGIGGLSVWREVRQALPGEPLIYLADHRHTPYGPRPAAEVGRFAHQITTYLIAQGADLIVLACNTATAAALDDLRRSYPQVRFVGMEPALKPAARLTRSGRVGVMATAGTFESQRYADLAARFTQDLQLYENRCDGLVELIEAGHLDSSQTTALLAQIIDPMIVAGVDTLILGCTHYPFVTHCLRRLVGPDMAIIDPAPAVAAQTARLRLDLGRRPDRSTPACHRFVTTGPLPPFVRQLIDLDLVADSRSGFVAMADSLTW